MSDAVEKRRSDGTLVAGIDNHCTGLALYGHLGVPKNRSTSSYSGPEKLNFRRERSPFSVSPISISCGLAYGTDRWPSNSATASLYGENFKIVAGALCSKFIRKKNYCSVVNETLLKSNLQKVV